MRHFMIAAGNLLFASSTFATGGTGIGKGSGSTPPTGTAPALTTTPPVSSCKPGDTDDKWQDICIGQDGKGYLPNHG